MSARPPVACVAFDLGGVLVDVDKAHLAAFGEEERVARAFFGARHDQMSVGALSADDYVRGVAEDLAASVVDVERAWRRVVRWRAGALKLTREVSRRCALRFWSNTDPLHWSELMATSRDGAQMADGRGFGSPIGICAPASEAQRLPRRLRRHNVDDDDVHTLSFRCGFMKPDAGFYAAAVAASGVDPGAIVFVDDRSDNVAAAIEAGIDAVVVASVFDAAAVVRDRLSR